MPRKRVVPSSQKTLAQREEVLDLLSDEEVSQVSRAETAAHLAEGDEFLDLQRLGDGVAIADGVRVRMGLVLPRKAVSERTWQQILELLAST